MTLEQPPTEPPAQPPARTAATAKKPKSAATYLRNFAIHAGIFAIANFLLSFSGNSWIAGVFSGEWPFNTLLSGIDGPFLANTTRIWTIVLAVDAIYALVKAGTAASRNSA